MKDNKKTKLILPTQMIATIKKHNMIANGDRIVIGVSGGADSVALLMALNSLKDEYNLTLVVCHLNHKIRPVSAERDQEFVKTLCDKLKVEFHTKDVEVETLAKESGRSTEDMGRQVRYDFFNEVAGEDGKIATAHNKNDNAETVIMRFMRGTGLQGLSGIPYVRGNIIRPILDVERADIEKYLKAIDQDHITDESNTEAIYTRNKIRLNLIPEIEKEFNPSFVQTLAKNIQIYQEDNDFIKSVVKEASERYVTRKENSFSVNSNMLENEYRAVFKRCIMNEFDNMFGVSLTPKNIDEIYKLFETKKDNGFYVNGELYCEFKNNSVSFYQKKKVKEAKDEREIYVAMCESSIMNVGGVQIKLSMVQAQHVVNNKKVFYLPENRFSFNTLFRTRRNGDVLTIDSKTSKKLKSYFISEKIPSETRDNFWMLSNNGRIVWIPGVFGSRLAEKERSGKFYKFEILI